MRVNADSLSGSRALCRRLDLRRPGLRDHVLALGSTFLLLWATSRAFCALASPSVKCGQGKALLVWLLGRPREFAERRGLVDCYHAEPAFFRSGVQFFLYLGREGMMEINLSSPVVDHPIGILGPHSTCREWNQLSGGMDSAFLDL